jgi:PilZ domain
MVEAIVEIPKIPREYCVRKPAADPAGFPFDFHFSVRRLLQMELRKAKRVVFERGFAANMMAIDGTWRRPCTMEDVSETGARLTVDGSIEGLPLKEFFLLLSTMGNAYRRCQLAWVNGDQVGVFFLKPGDNRKKY